MTVLIPYTDDRNNGTELLHSIRSLVKHFRAMDNVVVVGDLPRWYSGDHIPLRDIPIRREYSMYIKAMTAAKQYNLTEFLYSTDDHFCLTDFDESLPNYYTSDCKSKALSSTSGRYRRMYANCPEGWLNFDCHTPIMMRPFAYVSTRNETDTPIKSTYANGAGVTGTPIVDCKFFNGHSYEQIKAIIAQRQFFSTSPFSQNKDMLRVLDELYPEKSHYEK
jgi:hypothetical protein